MNANLIKFSIQNFDLLENTIEVVIPTGSTSQTVIAVPRERFEKWLRTDDRLNTELNYADHTGEHVQCLGLMSLYEYWDLQHRYIIKDLYDFITTKMDCRKQLQPRFTDFQSFANNFFSQVKTAIR